MLSPAAATGLSHETSNQSTPLVLLEKDVLDGIKHQQGAKKGSNGM